MKNRRLVPALALLLLLGACSSPTATADPLVGTWFAQITPVTSDNQTQTFTFRTDRTYTAVHTQLNAAASTTNAGCTEAQTDVGTYTTNSSSGMMTLTFVPTAGMSSQVVRSGCTTASDNGTSMTTPSSGGTVGYSIVGNTLTYVSGSSTVFTRR